MKVTLSRDALHTGNLILVNEKHPLRGNGHAKYLVPIGEENGDVLLDRRAASVLQRLMDELGCKEQIVAVSGYRSEKEQAYIYQSSLQDNGADFTAKYVARPGHSEHQSGLAVDLALRQADIDALRPFFPYTGVCGAFRRMAVPFGFTERYPEGKEDITGIAHEPWHFRYVGAPHAAIMRDMEVTLEEYLAWLARFPLGRAPFRYVQHGWDVEISYLPAKGQVTLFETEDGLPYLVSGDNIGGFILTVWRARA